MLFEWFYKLKSNLIRVYWKTEHQRVVELLRKELLSDTNKVDPRFAKEISYMRECNEIMFIPYKFTEHYHISDIKVKYDPREKLKYVIHAEKRLYFPDGSEASIKRQYHQLLIEQDPESPHRYFSDGYEFEDGMIFVDVGAAEGLLSLEVVERAKEIYLFECDKAWIRALSATFRPWKDKVHIIPKYAGRKCGRNCVALDSFFAGKEKERFFIKMDVEGMEKEVLEGAQSLLRNKRQRVVCATYHRQDAAKILREYFRYLNYTTEFSKNYILFHYGLGVCLNGKYNRIRYPYFRRGLIRAKSD